MCKILSNIYIPNFLIGFKSVLKFDIILVLRTAVRSKSTSNSYTIEYLIF